VVKIFKSSCQAFHRAKLEMLKFFSHNRRENELKYKVHGQGGGGCATKEI